MRSTRILLAVAVSSVAALGVAQTAQKPTFDVASIKPRSVPPPLLGFSGQSYMPSIHTTGGRLVASGTTLRALVQFAYKQTSASGYAALYTIVGGPKFIDENHYDVEAKTDKAVPLEEIQAMVRSLLEERFALVLHAETREIPVYQLVIGRGGLKMKKLPDDAKGYLRIIPENGEAHALYAAPLSTFVGQAQVWADRLIIDKTGLTGMFEMFEAANPADDATVRFEDNTGLRLIPAIEMVEVLVIDHAEKPSEN